MTESENIVYNALVNDGWKVLRGGWPDFLAEKDGELRFIEVKSASSPNLSSGQQEMHEMLSKHGFTTRVLLAYTKPVIEDVTLPVTEEDIMNAMRRRS